MLVFWNGVRVRLMPVCLLLVELVNKVKTTTDCVLVEQEIHNAERLTKDVGVEL